MSPMHANASLGPAGSFHDLALKKGKPTDIAVGERRPLFVGLGPLPITLASGHFCNLSTARSSQFAGIFELL